MSFLVCFYESGPGEPKIKLLPPNLDSKQNNITKYCVVLQCEFVTGDVEEVEEYSLERAPVKVEDLYPQMVSVHTETEKIKETRPFSSQHESIQYTVGV